MDSRKADGAVKRVLGAGYFQANAARVDQLVVRGHCYQAARKETS
jgi:hypothetical protein